ncbi:hypothetical protein [Apibacter adventoris]|uniref:Uncharacterized protein n=1 Tax=Apibacter adventoris TaxID=1679466 RepID=A0A2S8A9A3_9FLAO|nr:hypothetical protein [Apibacter adventoris]PQL91142.1 hypothetical protein C4S77_08660 [Apibacter adventoris]
MNIKKIIITIIITVNFISCTQNESKKLNKTQMNKDPFYTENSGYDYIRFPLIKPYETISLNKGEEWAIKSDFKPKTPAEIVKAYGIQKINILLRKIIICYCEKYPIIGGEEFPKAWFIFIPEKNINKGFTTEQEFRAYLQTQGIQKEQIEWNTPKELYEQFSKTYCLSWIPDCN